MSIYLLVFMRLIHVIAGILWAGTAVFYLFFVKPTALSLGPIGPQFMQNLVQRRRYPLYMMTTSILTILAGAVLYWFSSGGLHLGWLRTGPGLGFTIGSVASLGAFFIGAFGISPTSARMGKLGGQIAAAGGPPAPEQKRQLQALEKKLGRFENLDFLLLAIAMITMATARYWLF